MRIGAGCSKTSESAAEVQQQQQVWEQAAHLCVARDELLQQFSEQCLVKEWRRCSAVQGGGNIGWGCLERVKSRCAGMALGAEKCKFGRRLLPISMHIKVLQLFYNLLYLMDGLSLCGCVYAT